MKMFMAVMPVVLSVGSSQGFADSRYEANWESLFKHEAVEGPTAEPSGGFADARKFLKLQYTAKDFRYTRSKDGAIVYAMIPGWPGAGEISIFETFAKDSSKVKCGSHAGL